MEVWFGVVIFIVIESFSISLLYMYIILDTADHCERLFLTPVTAVALYPDITMMVDWA